jgi:hypothetical protein
MKAARTSETLVDNYFTFQYIPEDNSELYTRHCENLKCHVYIHFYQDNVLNKINQIFREVINVLLAVQNMSHVCIMCCLDKVQACRGFELFTL